MAARMSIEDQIKFLLSCVKWSVNGKIDFDQVASECGVVTKGAAAKRYERMQRQAQMQPGASDDNPAPVSKKPMLAPKVPKKRKAEDVTGFIKQYEIEERTLPPSKRPRNDIQHEVKQEPLPPPNYPPYMFHPMMTPQGPYIHRPLPPSLYPNMPYGMSTQMQPFSHRLHAPHPMFPAMHNNHQLMSPLPQQLQSLHLSQNIGPLAQESTYPAILDDIHNYDFCGGGYEAMLNGDPMANESLQLDDMMKTKSPQQATVDQQPEVQDSIKAEPDQHSPAPFRDPSANKVTAAAQLEIISRAQTHINPVGTSSSLTGPTVPDTPDEPEKHTTRADEALVPKEENDQIIQQKRPVWNDGVTKTCGRALPKLSTSPTEA